MSKKCGPNHLSKRHTETCKVEGCERPYCAKGFCDRHYQIDRRRPGQTELLVAPAGSGWIDQKGYHRIKIAGKTRMVHCLLMQDHIGRDLLPDETVHHINGVRDDNRIENLELRCGYHPQGTSPEDLVPWAREILRRYA